jgi:hypothetical protein
MDAQPLATPKRGRPPAIPPSAYGLVFRLYSEGLGYRAIADRLAEMRLCYPTKSSVERMIKGLPPYQGRRVLMGHKRQS